jgi:hypothetical protein
MFRREKSLRIILVECEAPPFSSQIRGFQPGPSSFHVVFTPFFCTIHGEKTLQISPSDTISSLFEAFCAAITRATTSVADPPGMKS